MWANHGLEGLPGSRKPGRGRLAKCASAEPRRPSVCPGDGASAAAEPRSISKDATLRDATRRATRRPWSRRECPAGTGLRRLSTTGHAIRQMTCAKLNRTGQGASEHCPHDESCINFGDFCRHGSTYKGVVVCAVLAGRLSVAAGLGLAYQTRGFLSPSLSKTIGSSQAAASIM
jgi:hypothetical protein